MGGIISGLHSQGNRREKLQFPPQHYIFTGDNNVRKLAVIQIVMGLGVGVLGITTQFPRGLGILVLGVIIIGIGIAQFLISKRNIRKN